MNWGKKIILGLIAAVTLDQTLRILSTWQFEGNTAFFERVVAEADFAGILKEQRETTGFWRGGRACEFHRSWVGYRVKICLNFRLKNLNDKDHEVKNDLSEYIFSLFYHEPRSIISIMTADYYFNQLPGKTILIADGMKRNIQWSK